MKDFVYTLDRPKFIDVHELAFGELHANWVRVKVLFCGICGSDMSKFNGHRKLDYPESIGHEFVGRIIQVGRDISKFAVGDVVTTDLNYRCGLCSKCFEYRSHLCERNDVGLFSNRGFASTVDIEVSYLTTIDGAMGPHLALSEPLSCVLHAKNWAQITPTDRVLIIGAGGIGLCMAFAFFCDQSAPLVAIHDKSAGRLDNLIEPMGHSGMPLKQVDDLYDVVFDLSGTASGLELAASRTASGGRLCSMTHLADFSETTFLLEALTRRDITFTVSYLNGEPENLKEATSMLASSWNQSWNNTIEVLGRDRIQNAFEQRHLSRFNKTIIEVWG